MSTLEIRAEIIKLGRVLDLDPARLEFMSAVPAAEIRRLRETAHEFFFNRGRSLFQNLAAATKLLPGKLTAFMGEKVFGPVFVARIAGEMPADRAVEIAQRMPTGFLADVCLQLDPRRVGEIIRQMPPEKVRDVALELVRRGEYITMGLFVGYLSEPAIKLVMAAITDEEHLLRIGLFIEARPQIPKLMRMLPDVRLRNFIKLAQDESKNLWAEALSLMAHADTAMMRKLGDMMVDEGEVALTRLLQRSQAQGLWSGILPLIAQMSPDRQSRLVHLEALADPEVLASLFRTAEEEGLWRLILPLVAGMTQGEGANAARSADPAKLLRLFHAAEQARLLPRLLALVEQFSTEERCWMATIAAAMPAELQERFADEVDRADLWAPLFEVAGAIPPEGRAALGDTVRRIASKRPELVGKLSDQAAARGLDDLVAAARSGSSG